MCGRYYGLELLNRGSGDNANSDRVGRCHRLAGRRQMPVQGLKLYLPSYKPSRKDASGYLHSLTKLQYIQADIDTDICKPV